jgi:hypothetical protein
MTVLGQETTACVEEGMDNDALSFDVVLDGSGNRLIQAAQGGWQLIAVQGCGAQRPN